MKVTISEKQTEGEVKYPCLMEFSNNNNELVIVVMDKIFCGICVYSEDKDVPKGMHSNTWNPKFKPFKGSITLEND